MYEVTRCSIKQTFFNPTPVSGDDFGSSVSISGDSVLIGDRIDDTNVNLGGAAYLFDATSLKYTPNSGFSGIDTFDYIQLKEY